MKMNSENYNGAQNIISVGNNSIGPYYWVGHCMNGVDYYAGQTFTCTSTGTLKRIKLFPSIVFGDTRAQLQLYAFDKAAHTWKELKAETQQQVNKGMEGNWISFELPAVPVQTGTMLGFKLSCNSGGMLAIAECPWSTLNPYPEGEEWIGSSEAKEGHFHKDFDLAFEAQIELQ